MWFPSGLRLRKGSIPLTCILKKRGGNIDDDPQLSSLALGIGCCCIYVCVLYICVRVVLFSLGQ